MGSPEGRLKTWILRTHFYWCQPWVVRTLLMTAFVAFVVLGLLILADVF